MSESRSIVAKLRAEVGDFVTGMNKAGAAAKKVGDETESTAKRSKKSLSGMAAGVRENEQHYDRLGNAALIGGGAIAAGIGFGVKAFADFDSAMSGANAALAGSGANMEKLRQLAIDLGKDTQFSSTEAAQGITELAKAGVDARDIMGGGLAGALSLAAAGELEVADAAEIAASAMTQFKLKGSDIPHIADLLAAGAGKAQGSVRDMGMALNQAGLVASQTGLTIEETTGALAAFASAGLVGSDAGTSLKTMLQRLTPQSEEAAKQFEALGVSAYDSQGNFVGLTDFAGQLQEKLSKLTPEARNSALGVMFGSDAVRAASVIYEQGAGGVQAWIDKVNDAGFAAEQAALKTDNLRGDWERFTGALDAVAVSNGGGANDFLRSLTQNAEGAVEAFGRLPGPIQQGTLGLVALAGGGLLAFGALSKVVTSGANMLESLTAIQTSGGRAAKGLDVATKSAKALGATAAIVGATALAVKALVEASNDDFKMAGVGQLTRDLTGAADASKALDAAFSTAGQKINGSTSLIDDFDEALKVATDPSRFQSFEGSVAGLFGMFDDTKVGVATAQFERLDETLSSMFSAGHTDQAATLFDTVRSRAEAAGVPVEELNRLFPTYTDALAAASAEQELGAESGAKFAGELQGLGDEANDAEVDIGKLADAVRGFGGSTMDAQAAEAQFQEAIIATTAAAGENNVQIDKATGLVKLNSAAGREGDAALRGLAGAAKESASAMLESGGSAASAEAKIASGRAEFVKAATQMGLTKTQANNLADAYGLMPANVGRAEQSMKDFAKNTDAALKGIDNRSVNVGVFLRSNEKLSGLEGFNTGSGKADGGLVRRDVGGIIPGPYKGPRADNVLGVDANGTPFVRVNPQEFITRVSSTRSMMAKRPGVLEYINHFGDLPPEYLQMRGFAGGGQVSLSSSVPSRDDVDSTVNASFDRFMAMYGPAMAKKLLAAQAVATGGPGMGYKAQVAWAQKNIPWASITSTLRTGNPASDHDKGRAIDLAGGNMGKIFDIIKAAYGPAAIRSLYHSPKGAQQVRFNQVSNTPPHIYNSHFDHVHWAMANGGTVPRPLLFDRGGVLPTGTSLVHNGTGAPEPLARIGGRDGDLVDYRRLAAAVSDNLRGLPEAVRQGAHDGVAGLDGRVSGVVQQELGAVASKSRRQGVTA